MRFVVLITFGLLTGCAARIGSYRIECVNDFTRIQTPYGTPGRARIDCLSKLIVYHCGDEKALWHELRHAADCEIDGTSQPDNPQQETEFKKCPNCP